MSYSDVSDKYMHAFTKLQISSRSMVREFNKYTELRLKDRHGIWNLRKERMRIGGYYWNLGSGNPNIASKEGPPVYGKQEEMGSEGEERQLAINSRTEEIWFNITVLHLTHIPKWGLCSSFNTLKEYKSMNTNI